MLGDLLLAISADPQSTTAWKRGAQGEQWIGFRLDRLAPQVVTLHDRRMPGSRANIDHLVIAPSGVWVIDAKRYRGVVTKTDVGRWFRTDLRLYVDGRDRTTLLDGAIGQEEALREALGTTWAHVPVRPVLCFVGTDWPIFAEPFRMAGVTISWPRRTVRMLRQAGPLEPDAALALANHLDQQFPPA